MKRLLIPLLVAAAAATTGVHAAEKGSEILAQRCAGCHALAGPAPQTLQQLWARKAPDLFYAGNKYRAEWLRTWLQKPNRIRPAGEFYADHVRRGEKGDEIDTAALEQHLALSAGEAGEVTEALMRLKAHDDLIAAEKIEAGSLSKSMGEMAFDKFLGCMACHQIEPGLGGASGPELYTAGRRLQAEFIASYIRGPQAWDPKIWMPNKHVTDANILKLVRYLGILATEQGNVK